MVFRGACILGTRIVNLTVRAVIRTAPLIPLTLHTHVNLCDPSTQSERIRQIRFGNMIERTFNKSMAKSDYFS